MASLNRVILMGNLTGDPRSKSLQSGTSVANFRLAMNRRYRDKQGEDRDEACFVDVEVFGRQADAVGQYLSKGSPALVEGRLRYDQWDDRESGEKRSKLLVRADRVQFVGTGGRGSGENVSESEETYQSAPAAAPQAHNEPQSEGADATSSAGQGTAEESADDIPF